MNTIQTVEDVSIADANPFADKLLNSKFQLVHNTDWKTVEVNGEDVNIPQDWEIVSAESHICLIQEQRKHQIPSAKILKSGIIPVISQEMDFVNGYTDDKNKSIAAKNNPCLIFGDHTTVLKYVDFDFVLGGDGTKVFRPIKGNCKFMYFSLKNRVNLIGYSRHFKFLKELNVNTPSLAEQTLIAQTLTAQEDHIASLKQQSSIQRKRLDWLTDELLSGRIRVEEDVNGQPTVLKRDEHGNAVESLPAVRLVANTDWKTVEVNGEDVEIPEGWDMSSPSLEKFKIQTGRKNANDNSLDGIYPFFTCSVENVLKISSYSFDTEALLINGNGDVGHVKYYKGKFDAYQRVYVVNNIEMDIHYVRLIFEKYFKSSLSVQGGAMPYIKVDAILNFDFRKPSLDEQTLIAQTLTAQEEYIASLDQMIAIEEKRLAWLTDELLSGRILIQEVK